MNRLLLGFAIWFTVIIVVFVLAWRQVKAWQREASTSEDDHWLEQALVIRAVDPEADVSFCFSRNRPPRRNSSAPAVEVPSEGYDVAVLEGPVHVLRAKPSPYLGRFGGQVEQLNLPRESGD